MGISCLFVYFIQEKLSAGKRFPSREYAGKIRNVISKTTTNGCKNLRYLITVYKKTEKKLN